MEARWIIILSRDERPVWFEARKLDTQRLWATGTGQQRRTEDIRPNELMDPFQGGMETFEIQCSLSSELAKGTQSRRDGMSAFAADQKQDSCLRAHRREGM